MMPAGPKFHDMVLIFICQSGFRLVGNSTLSCNGRQWSSDPPDCVQQPSTTLSVLPDSSSSTSASGSGVVSLSSPSFTSDSYFPVSPFDAVPTEELPRAPVMSSDVVRDSWTSTSRYPPALNSTPASLESSAAGTSTSVMPGDVVSTATVSQYQHHRPTGAILTSFDATTAVMLPRFTVGRTTSRSLPQTSSVHSGRLTWLPAIVSSEQSGTTSRMIADTLLTTAAGEVGVAESSEEHRGGRTLLWYATVAGSCVVVLAAVGAVCGVIVHRRTIAFRRYQLMGGDDMQSTATATVALDRSIFYASQYTELKSTCVSDEQNNLSRQTQPSSQFDDYSF